MILAFTYIVEEPQDDYSKKNHKRNQDGGEDSLQREKNYSCGNEINFGLHEEIGTADPKRLAMLVLIYLEHV